MFDFNGVSQLAPILDVLGAVLSVLGTLAALAGSVWLFFRTKISKWWSPYRAGIDAMSDVPGIRREIEGTRRDIERVRAGLTVLTLTMRARGDANDRAGEFESNGEGSITAVNLTYARWLGVGKAELQGFGWVNFIHPDDIGRYRAEWARCTREHRAFRQRHRLIDMDGAIIEVDTLITPIPDAPPASHWIGVTRRVME